MITSGRISMTPFRVVTPARPDEVQKAFAASRYPGTPTGAGWGSLFDESDDLVRGFSVQRPKGGSPLVLTDQEPYPDQVLSRLYWNEPQPQLVKAGVTGPAAINQLRAADVILGKVGEEYWGVASVSGRTTFDTQISPRIDSALEEAGFSARVIREGNPFELGDADFFRWLLYRSVNSSALNDDLTLDGIEEIDNQGQGDKITRLKTGVDLQRPEVLTFIASDSNRFGPARFSVISKSLALTVQLEMSKEGHFQVLYGSSAYADDVADGFDAPHLRVNMVKDSAFEVIPELLRLHSADSNWRHTHRDEFRDEALVSLRSIYG